MVKQLMISSQFISPGFVVWVYFFMGFSPLVIRLGD
jgi:hypothetical protein